MNEFRSGGKLQTSGTSDQADGAIFTDGYSIYLDWVCLCNQLYGSVVEIYTLGGITNGGIGHRESCVLRIE